MKNKLLRIVLLALAFSLVLCSCGKSEKDYAVYAKDSSGNIISGMTEGMFSYFLSQQKSNYLMVLMFNDKTLIGDTPEAWDKLSPDGRSYGDAFYDTIVEEAKNIVAANAVLFSQENSDGKKYSLPEDYLDYVDALVRRNAQEKYGNVMNFESYLMNFGATLEDYTQLYLMTANVDLLKEAMFSDGGWFGIPDEDKKKYYTDNYYTVEHVFVDTAYETKIDGTKAPLSDAEVRNREAIAHSIKLDVENGILLSELADSYTQSYVTVYPGRSSMDINGSTSVKELGDAVKTMKLGEVREVSSAYGIHIIKRVETDPEAFDDDETIKSSITSILANERYPEKLSELAGEIEINPEIIESFDIRNVILP